MLWIILQVVKLVRAIRKGWIKLDKPKAKPEFYLMWGDDLKTSDKTANGLAFIPAPKPKLPGIVELHCEHIERGSFIVVCSNLSECVV